MNLNRKAEKQDASAREPKVPPCQPAAPDRLRIVHDAARAPGTINGDGAAATTRRGSQEAAGSDWSALMVRAQQGEADAYRRLLEEVTPYLRGLASHYLADREAVEDAVQETLLTVHRLRHTYDGRRPFGPWLATIARRRSIDRFRVEARQRARETELEPVHETFAADHANSYEKLADRRALHSAVDALPPGQQEAIRLLGLGEMSLAEASRASGKSVGALKTAAHRALNTLRKAFAGTDAGTEE